MAASRKRVRYTFDIHFKRADEEDTFLARLKRAREHLTPPGRPSVDNSKLMLAPFDSVEGDGTQPVQLSNIRADVVAKSFLQSGGKCKMRVTKLYLYSLAQQYIILYMQESTLVIPLSPVSSSSFRRGIQSQTFVKGCKVHVRVVPRVLENFSPLPRYIPVYVIPP